jgi:hypothetical protein
MSGDSEPHPFYLLAGTSPSTLHAPSIGGISRLTDTVSSVLGLEVDTLCKVILPRRRTAHVSQFAVGDDGWMS